jgi:hypothetical protein
LLFCIFPVIGAAQNTSKDFEQFFNSMNREYENFKQQTQKEYDDFRKQVNDEYAAFMQQSWKEYQALPAISKPKDPKPFVKPPVVDPSKKPTRDILPVQEVINPPILPKEQPKPIEPIPVTPKDPSGKPAKTIRFYHTECSLPVDASYKFSLKNLNNNTLAAAWKDLSQKKYDPLITGCLDVREKLRLCDWGYVEFLRTMTDDLFTSKNPNEAVFLQMFILTQSGYKVRLAKADNRLALLLPLEVVPYGYSYFQLDGLNYYLMDKSLKGKSADICTLSFPKEQLISLYLRQAPAFAYHPTPVKNYTISIYPALTVPLSVNKNLIDFYNSYPQMADWGIYSRASLSDAVKGSLYPVLQKNIAGKTETEAANLLLRFVQTAFKYETDGEQFGYERPLFGDETFYYPYSDCEDRAILYSILVHDLLRLEVVLLHYPNHLATAVNFKKNIEGDFLMVNGEKYVVCDPTYINASIGMAMPEYKKVKAIVVKTW